MESTPERNDGFGMAVLVESAIGIAAVLLAWLFNVSLRDQIAPMGAPLAAAAVRGLIATLPMLVVFAWLVTSKLPPLQQLREQVEWLVREMFPDASAAQFALIAALAGVGEELLFRGVLQTKLGSWTTPIVGLVLTSILFGLAHALSRLYLAFAIIVGLYLGWLALEYHDLVAPMIAHGLYDFVALVYLSRTISRRRQKASTSSNDSPANESQLDHDDASHH
jgi:membrane protease YdiL (CAAX protease family)